MGETPDDRQGGDADAITIMVIEPDVLVRMVIADYLRLCGYKVVEGVTAEDAFAVLGADRPVQVVLADARLPGALDGFGLARELRRSRPEIDVVLTSNVSNAAKKAGDLCDEGPLEKPYHPREVVRRINILRERRRNSAKRSE